MTDTMLGPSPMHIKYVSYVYGGFCIYIATYRIITGIDIPNRYATNLISLVIPNIVYTDFLLIESEISHIRHVIPPFDSDFSYQDIKSLSRYSEVKYLSDIHMNNIEKVPNLSLL